MVKPRAGRRPYLLRQNTQPPEMKQFATANLEFRLLKKGDGALSKNWAKNGKIVIFSWDLLRKVVIELTKKQHWQVRFYESLLQDDLDNIAETSQDTFEILGRIEKLILTNRRNWPENPPDPALCLSVHLIPRSNKPSAPQSIEIRYALSTCLDLLALENKDLLTFLDVVDNALVIH
ncbi:MAG: hypothetical protein ACYCSG_00075 [Thermoplasmataceae archaeon]